MLVISRQKHFSVAKATLQSQISVRLSVCPSVRHKAKPFNSLKSSSFIIHLSSFIILHSSFIILHHSSFILHHFSFILYLSYFITQLSSFIILHSSFIVLHSSFLHFATFKPFGLFGSHTQIKETDEPVKDGTICRMNDVLQ